MAVPRDGSHAAQKDVILPEVGANLRRSMGRKQPASRVLLDRMHRGDLGAAGQSGARVASAVRPALYHGLRAGVGLTAAPCRVAVFLLPRGPGGG